MSITLNKLRTFENRFITKVLETKDKFIIQKFLEEWGLQIKDKKILPKPEYKKIWAELYDYWDKKQLVKKINLNSALELCALN